MPALSDLLAFALVSLAMVLTPGPNMIYVISRSICQGPLAGLISSVARCTCSTWRGRR
jgi:threonine/homoserine/homoserine lactone efflux protein